MPLLLSLLPVYIFGNLHCIGMCGPLVMMIGRHRYRYLYFFGRTLSFALAGLTAGALGAVINIFLNAYHLSALMSLTFGSFIFFIGLGSFFDMRIPGSQWLMKRMAKANHTLSVLMLRDQPWPTFLFGFFTVALPCGQTLVVFSACALYGDPLAGLFNGLVFALMTSPALFAAMHAHRLFQSAKKYYNLVIGVCALLIGALAICRGLADLDLIPHLILNPQMPSHYHLVIY